MGMTESEKELIMDAEYRKTDESSVVCNINSPKYRLLRLRNKLFISKQKKALLQRFCWFQTISGRWNHPHCIDHLTHKEIMPLTPKQLEYKLKHGSMSTLPDNLK